ncbi:STAS domain-containing protein [Actinomadura sp. ATCC 31491]|uniref:STAS domain-containing protein n=1 Tax=Actinomadura luzonensis TaxID=2805427 RepID=A0ABT0FXI3_9ACTN|nr:STAS domain-containing protein [Actinomadura luzonensis]MCK2217055.1 STAS domain-containing protein [Actinomadura luzonensis]
MTTVGAHRRVPDYRRHWAAIVLEGRLDRATAAGIEREMELLAGDGPRLVLEVSRLGTLDAFEVETLLSLAHAFRLQGGLMAVAGVREQVRPALARPELTGLLPVFTTMTEAMLQLSDGPTAGGAAGPGRG